MSTENMTVQFIKITSPVATWEMVNIICLILYTLHYILAKSSSGVQNIESLERCVYLQVLQGITGSFQILSSRTLRGSRIFSLRVTEFFSSFCFFAKYLPSAVAMHGPAGSLSLAIIA